jgi:hypothetical protein
VFTHVHNVALRRRLPLLAFALGICVFAGCTLFRFGDGAQSIGVHRPTLPRIQTSSESIQLEIQFVDRVADDPLLGPTLWREVDQIAAIPSETREMLQQNGFQLGHVASSPPPAVQSLLGVGFDPNSGEGGGKQKLGEWKFLPPGVEFELQATEPIEKCVVSIAEGQRSKSYEYEQVRFMFRVKSARLHDGWVRIDFQPEIHHGDLRDRYTPTDDGWAYRSRQKVDARQAQQFSLTMNVGEFAIITAAPGHPDSMGERFFCRDESGTKRQRLLIVRVLDAGKSPDSY